MLRVQQQSARYQTELLNILVDLVIAQAEQVRMLQAQVATLIERLSVVTPHPLHVPTATLVDSIHREARPTKAKTPHASRSLKVTSDPLGFTQRDYRPDTVYRVFDNLLGFFRCDFVIV